MKKIIVLFAILVITAEYSIANVGFNYGAMDAGSINQRYTRDMRTHEFQTRAKSKSAIVTTKTQPQTQQQVTTSNLKSVIFINNSSIPSKELLAVISSKINKPMSIENISAIRKDIMRYYQSKGYFSAVALIPSVSKEVVYPIGNLKLSISFKKPSISVKRALNKYQRFIKASIFSRNSGENSFNIFEFPNASKLSFNSEAFSSQSR